MNATPKDALKEARISADYEGTSVAYSSIAQAEALTRLADAVEELVVVVRAGLAARSLTHATDSPAVRRAVKIYNNGGLTLVEALAAILDDHDEHLQAMVKSQARAIDAYRTTIKRLRKKLRRAERYAPAAALWRDAALAATNARNALAEQLIAAKKDAASLPVWQPVEPGTVIKAGTLHRIEWAARPGLRSGEYVLSYDALASEGVRTLVVPRTVPAEPVGPDADAVEVSRA